MPELEAAEIFKALSVPSRLEIFTLLKREGPMPVKAIAETLRMTPPAVSQHLKILRTAGLVSAQRRGYWVPYSVDARALSDCCGMLVRICACPGHGADVASEPCGRVEGLLGRREELLRELQRVEAELDALRE